jgi:Tripartite tricarboxylate transporter TctB family
VKADRLFGIAVCLLALAFVTLAVPSIDAGEATAYYTVGPHLFPYLAGVLVLVLGALVAARPQHELPNMAGVRKAAGRRQVGALILLMLSYVAGVPLLGFTAASTAVLLLFLILFGERRWSVIAPLVLLGPLFVEFVFLRAFGLSLPDGIFELSVF